MSNHALKLAMLIALTTTFGCGQAAGQYLRNEPEIESQPEGPQIKNERFGVYYSHDYGYRLLPINNDTISLAALVNSNNAIDLIPEFETTAVRDNFRDFFTHENLSENIGKGIYCDCVGERFDRGGIAYFRVHSAKIFAQ